MTDWYAGRVSHWSDRHREASARALALSRARLLTFLAAAALLWWGAHRGSGAVVLIALAGFVAFAWLAAVHDRVLLQVARCEAAQRFNHRRLATLARDWPRLPDAPAPTGVDVEAHGYAADLDLFGHASLATWLGPAATRDGTRHLWAWLLSPAAPETIATRQTAIDDLAPRRAWRESLAIEGVLSRVEPADLAGFLTWAESSASAVPRGTWGIAVLLALSIWGLLALYLTGVTPAPWWLIPLLVGVVISYAFAARVYRTFDRAAIGERSLPRYASMLAFVCAEEWTAPALVELQARLRGGGDAPALVRRLARLSEWSELRTGAALLHFPIQAFTLWDFHILFALERWRTRVGASVRGWLDALGEIDALAVLAAVRADEPTWAVPRVDPGAAALESERLGHPLIAPARRVDNDVRVGPRGHVLLVTGSNMSGKSTLLRAIGLNVVLAQAGAPVCAAAFTMPPADVFTSILVHDSLERGLSYFMAALARLKAIVDAAEGRPPGGRVLLYLLDEVLQGTNSTERAIAVRAIVRHLLDAGAIGAITTHDLAIAREEPLSSSATLVHFTEQVHADGTMTFDYRLRPGLATSTNAIRLMQLMGIQPR